MSGIDFIKNSLIALKNKFPELKIRYEYRDYLSIHVIEVLPFDTFENNHDYLMAEMSIQDEFEALYGGQEEILFISTDSLNEIRNVYFEL